MDTLTVVSWPLTHSPSKTAPSLPYTERTNDTFLVWELVPTVTLCARVVGIAISRFGLRVEKLLFVIAECVAFVCGIRLVVGAIVDRLLFEMIAKRGNPSYGSFL